MRICKLYTKIKLKLALCKRPNRVDVFLPHLRTEIDPVSEMLCFLISRIPDGGRRPETQ
jgi:hypothetical protein